MADLRAGIDVARGARRWSTEFTLDFIGNLIGWGVHLGILLETQDPAGSPVWTLRSREMRYGVLGGRAVQVRDLEPEAQARIERKLRAQAKLNATLDARHSEKVAPEIRQLLADIVLADTGARIPEGWGVYVPADIREQWPRIGDAMGILVDLHRDWDRGLQARWVERVREERRDALVRAAVRKEETEALEAQILADDDAFATLGDL
ncbi:hypothetical protein CRT23_20530 [Methylobacterium sp. V23]|nr:hypothetical protein CRT23_20530 [Methylobacterium sp. V23]